MTQLDLRVARKVLAAQPFNDLVGAELTAFGDGEAVLEIGIADRHRQQFGLVHGGVLAYCVDNVLTFAAGTVLGPSILTGGLTVTYLAGAREGRLRATGRVLTSDGKRAVVDVTVDEVTPDGSVRTCAAGQGTAVVTGR